MRYYFERTIWVTQLDETTFMLTLREAGAIGEATTQADRTPLVRYDGGTQIVTASAEAIGGGDWAVTLEWLAVGPVGAEIFVHVRDGNGTLVVQADGPALGGLIPIWMWRAGDVLRDVRYFSVPPDAPSPYSVQVGIYSGEGRFPAYVSGQRVPDDAATVIVVSETQ